MDTPHPDQADGVAAAIPAPRMIIHAFNGAKGSGKRHVCGLLEEHYRIRGRHVARFSYAETLKAMLGVMLKDLGIGTCYITDPALKETVIPELGVTGRHLMQSLGTEWGRNMVHMRLWLKIMDRKLAY